MLSIIIPAHNEEDYIENCLRSIKNNIKSKKSSTYEIIVICDACTDKTCTIAKRFTSKVFCINRKNVSAARNYGAAKAVGDVLVFLDADCTISSNLLFEIEKAIKKGYVGGVTKTKSIEPSLKANIIWSIGNFFRHIFIAGSGLIFCRAEAFCGFDESRRLAEDTNFLLRLKKKGRLKYITNSFIKTSSRRWERQGYFKTIYKQFSAFFVKDSKGY